VVVSDCVDTDTTAFADVKLPALAWGEKDGTVTNSERRISRQRALFPPPGQARADWRIMADVARPWASTASAGPVAGQRVPRMGAPDGLREPRGQGERLLNLSGLAAADARGLRRLSPVQWPVTADGRHAALFVDGRFQTPTAAPAWSRPVRRARPMRSTRPIPLSLNTGRVRDQWHTMTRTGLAPDLCRHAPEPFVEVHPADAEAAGRQGGRPGPGDHRARRGGGPGQGHRPPAAGRAVHADALDRRLRAVRPRQSAGRAERRSHLRPAGVQAHPRPAARLSRDLEGLLPHAGRLASPPGLDLVWRRIPQDACQQHEFAGRGDEVERAALRKVLTKGLAGELVTYEDAATGARREAWLRDGRLVAVLYVTLDRPPAAA
jgi:assimilatory nitrate reductase catalytic subunit